MDQRPSPTPRLLRGLLLGALLAGGAQAQPPAQAPLFLGAKATPNVVYTMDESWSMAWRHMPDEVRQGTTTYYGNPWATGPGDAGDGSGLRWGLSFHPADPSTCASSECGGSAGLVNAFVARANSSGQAIDLLSARLRSSAFNTIYYNPEVRYRPWYHADGTPFPDADPGAAWINPNNRGRSGQQAIDRGEAINLRGEFTFGNTRWCRSNTSTTANATTSSNATTPTCNNINGERLAPAVYYTYNGNGLGSAANFQRVRIMDSTSFNRGPGRTDCSLNEARTAATCTREQEYQNFANWFTYNRTRMFLAIASTSRAFAEQDEGRLRVGYGRIHQGAVAIDGSNSPGTLERGVRTFSGNDRTGFFSWLHALGGSLQTGSNAQLYGRSNTDHRFAGGTPLRQALDDVEQYFSRADNRGPWGATPGTNDGSAHLACRKCYHILMTDGMWTNDGPARHANRRANVDGSSGATIQGPAGSGITPYRYEPAPPYRDNADNTLADVAMYYWRNDLRTDLPNRVVPDTANPAFWQHMVNFTVGLGVSGTLPYPATWPELQAGTRQWPAATANTASAIDDLWHAAVNSRGEYFSATNPEEFAEGLSAILRSVGIREESSSSSIAANSTRLDTGTLVYQARFNSRHWFGEIAAYDLNSDGTLNNELWNTSQTGRIPAAGARRIFAATGTSGTLTTSAVNFTSANANWNALSASQRAALNQTAGADATLGGKARINWLRGDRSRENNITGFREREQVLGDIINSDPLFVGDREDFGYRSLPGAEGSSYATFLGAAGKQGRTNMLYVGANDGMLHGFNALTGEEVFGFVPLGVFEHLHQLTAPGYVHRYYVDGSPRAGDAYLDNTWKTVLVGSTGAGGRSVFALDITDPAGIGPASLLWEFSTAANATHRLGIAMSQPVIARVAADVGGGRRWVAIFGNGYESNDTVKLLVVDLATGALVRAIDTGVSGVNNGLASPVPVDMNNDRVTDYVYAGDLRGNLWKFDLTANTTAGWGRSLLFQARDAQGREQPITARPVVGRHPQSGLMVYFGTGKYFQEGDNVPVANPPPQSFYGIRDNQGALVQRSQLLRQEILFEGRGQQVDGGETGFDVRAVSDNGSGSAPDYGWYLDLVSPEAGLQGERVTAAAILRFGRVIFVANIPNADPCGFGGNSWLMELDAVTGGRLPYSALDVNNDGDIDNRDYIEVTLGDGSTIQVPVSGKGGDEMIKTPGVVGAGEVEYKYTSGSSGSIGVIREKGAGDVLGRQSWRQLQ